MRRLGPITVVVVVLLSACTGSATPEPTTSTSVVRSETTVARPSMVMGGLVPADPATLIPFVDAVPVVVGTSHVGAVSPDGRWAAIRSQPADGSSPRLTIVETETLEVIAEGEGEGAGMVVGDEGDAYYFSGGRLHHLGRGGTGPVDPGGPGTPGYFEETLALLPDGRVGYLTGPEDDQGPISLVLVGDDDIVIHEIDTVESGPIAPASPGLPTPENLVPAVAWDRAHDRAIVVLADEDGLVTVDLTSGAIEEHEHAPTGLTSGSYYRRDAFLSPDGTSLFIATGLLAVEPADSGWVAVVSPAPVTLVDTGDWSSGQISVEGLSLTGSPDGSVVATMGSTTTSHETGEPEVTQSPVYVIDTATGDPLVGFEGKSGIIFDVQFSRDGDEMYVRSRGDDGVNIDIVDMATLELAGSVGFADISLIGQAGLLAFHQG